MSDKKSKPEETVLKLLRALEILHGILGARMPEEIIRCEDTETTGDSETRFRENEAEELRFQRWAHDPALGSTARRQLPSGFLTPAAHDVESELSLQALAGLLECAEEA